MVAQKAERGEGPMVLTYADKAGKADYKRVPNEVKALHIVQRAGNKSKTYNLDEVPQSIKDSLVAFAVAQRGKVYIANHGDKDGSNVVDLFDAFWNDVKSGKVYSRSADGEKPGRKFDAVKWATVYRNALLAMSKKGRINKKTNKPFQPMSDQHYNDFVVALEAAPSKERIEKIAGWKKDGFFLRALKEYEFKNTEVDADATDLF